MSYQLDKMAPVRVTRDTVGTWTYTPLLATSVIKSEYQIRNNAQDTRIARIERAVHEHLVNYLDRPIVNQVRYHYFTCAPSYKDIIYLDEGPITDVSEIATFNNGTWNVMDTTAYSTFRLHDGSAMPETVPVQIETADDEWLEIEFDDVVEIMRIETTSGWTDVPAPIADFAMRLIVHRLTVRGSMAEVQHYSSGDMGRVALDAYRRTPILEVV